ncbi:hypothetical protein K439DRAFT_1640966 [Ramaria rubella]|nr:hypothetical protein K439DRAFT_1640966 [Ramaria rubella]
MVTPLQAPQLQQSRGFGEKLVQHVQRAQQLRAQGCTAENSSELNQILQFIQLVQAQQAAQHVAQRSQPLEPPTPSVELAKPITNGITPPAPQLIPSGTPSINYPPPSPPPPVSFSNEQLTALRAQIHAFKLITKGLPVPDNVQQAIVFAPQSRSEPQDVDTRDLSRATSVRKTPERASPIQVDEGPIPEGPYLEDDTTSLVYPYNAFTHPFSILRNASASKQHRLVIPSIMPSGLDPHEIIAERNRFVEARIEQRIRELSSFPSTIGDGTLPSTVPYVNDDDDPTVRLRVKNLHPGANAHGKLRALIELKGLRVREKQRSLRAQVVERLTHGTLLPIDRKEFRRYRKPTMRDARATEQLERKQRLDRERRAKQKHLEYLTVICKHGQDMLESNRARALKASRMGKAVQGFHAHAEKEEQKRIERISKERLKALKADDEEAYMKLIDTAKDTRITHLLKQTDSYLDSLAQAVVAQQNDDVHRDGPHDSNLTFETEDGPTDETTFGAQRGDDEDDKGKVDYYAVAHKISEKVTTQPSILVGGTLKDYQIKGLQWMVSLYNNRLNGILADEMGLGKTIQTISLITFLIERKRQPGPYLVVVPLSTINNWQNEFAKWAPAVRVLMYKGNPNARKALQGELRGGNYQVLITTYEYIIKDKAYLSRPRWVHTIIDEGHRMKNTQSKLSQTLTQFYHSRYRIILTGTPLQNNLPELWALLNFVLPKIFNSVKSFDEWFNTPFANTGSQDKIELNEEEQLLIIRRLHKVLRPFLLRRLKKDVESELPDKVENIIKVKMSGLQLQLYKQMKNRKMVFNLAGNAMNKGNAFTGLTNELMQFRKICQHPFLFEQVEDEINPGGFINDKLVRSSGKFELLSRILPKLFATGHRVLIFFQMTKVMDIMEDFMKWMNWEYLRLDGGTKTDERAEHVKRWNTPGSTLKVFILSTRAGGLGLNLQTADTVIIFDSDWNPHADLQAQDRAHRIGQTKAVRILRLITEKSVEEAIESRARAKLSVDQKVIQAGRFNNMSSKEEQESMLREILMLDHDQGDEEEAGDMNDDEVNEILHRSAEEMEIFRNMDIERERTLDQAWFSEGKRGPRPTGLMTVEELPIQYQRDQTFDPGAGDDEILQSGRGHRRRKEVSYNDGLSDEAWTAAVDAGEDPLDLVAARKARRGADYIEEDSSVGSPVPDSRGRKGKGKGRSKKENDYDSAPSNGKRKRGGGKSMSVTPSYLEDDDDGRDIKRRKTKDDVTPSQRARMKEIFTTCMQAVMECTDPDGRKRCDMFRDLPSRKEYPDYFQTISSPIAISTIRKRSSSSYYKTVAQYLGDWRLMFNNAKTYNQEGSWVYVDAEEMQKVLESTFRDLTAGSGLPGAEPGDGTSSKLSGMTVHAAMGSPQDDDEGPGPRIKGGRIGKLVQSDESYYSGGSDDE